MNMMTGVPATACPYCTSSLGRWPDKQLVHRCKACDRPLGRIRVKRDVRLYRIMPMLDLTKILGTAIAVCAMALMILDPGRIREFVVLIAFALTVYGLTDMLEGLLAIRTGIDRTARKLRTGPPATRTGWFKMGFGVATLSVALIGILARASLSSTL